MSSTDNHKKAIAITAACYGNKGLLTKIYYKILEDHPAAIVNAFEGLVKEPPKRVLLQDLRVGTKTQYICHDCMKYVDKIGIAGACIKCDPKGFDVPY